MNISGASITYFIFFVTTFAGNSQAKAPKACKSAAGKPGTCVNVKQCRGRVNENSVECRSSTGQRLTCCIGFRPKVTNNAKPGVCGVRPLAKLAPRSEVMKTEAIVGGFESWQGSWPWMAAVFEGRNYVCGGTLISKKCVLTAAHCFDGQDKTPKKFFVRMGEHNLYLDGKDEYPDEIQAETVHVHPNFEVNCSDDDIAVIRLSSPSDKTPVCLPLKRQKKQTFVGSNAAVCGWGTNKYDNQFQQPFSSYLQEIMIPIQTTKFCEERYKVIHDYKKSFKSGLEEKRFICAGVEDGSKDACLGDSGGPLVVETSINQWTLVGVVCIGYGCGMRGYPGIYTRVTQYQDWFMQFCSD